MNLYCENSNRVRHTIYSFYRCGKTIKLTQKLKNLTIVLIPNMWKQLPLYWSYKLTKEYWASGSVSGKFTGCTLLCREQLKNLRSGLPGVGLTVGTTCMHVYLNFSIENNKNTNGTIEKPLQNISNVTVLNKDFFFIFLIWIKTDNYYNLQLLVKL